MRQFITWAVVALLLGIEARSSLAQSADLATRQTAERLLSEGVDRYRAGDYAAALSRFQAAFDLIPSPKIHLNIGNVLQKLGRDAEAAEAYERFLAETPALGDIEEEKKDLAHRRLEELRGHLGRFSLQVHPQSALVTIDETSLRLRSDGRTYVRPGPHRISAAAPGYLPQTRDVEVSAGQEVRIELDLRRAAHPQGTGESGLKPELLGTGQQATPPGRGKKTWGLIIAGTGVAALASGAYFAAQAYSRPDEIRAKCSSGSPCLFSEFSSLDAGGQSASMAAKALFIVGGLGTLGGAILYYFGHREAAVSQAKVTITPVAGGISFSCKTLF